MARAEYAILADLLEERTRALRASEERFRNVIARTGDAIVIVNEQGIVCFVNPAAEQIFHRSAEQLVGSPFGFPLVDGETSEIDVVANAERRIAEMRVVETEWDGHPAFLASLRDVTDRKLAEVEREQLIRAEAARAQAEVARQRSVFLAQASEQLSASLDYHVALQAVAQVTVPDLADWSMVLLPGEDGAMMTTAAVVHVDPVKQALADEIQRRYPPALGTLGAGG